MRRRQRSGADVASGGLPESIEQGRTRRHFQPGEAGSAAEQMCAVAVTAGRILDGRGEPVRGVQVYRCGTARGGKCYDGRFAAEAVSRQSAMQCTCGHVVTAWQAIQYFFEKSLDKKKIYLRIRPRRWGMIQNRLKLAMILGLTAGALTLQPPEASASCYWCCRGFYGTCNFCGCWIQPTGHSACVPSESCETWCGGCGSDCGGQSQPCEIR